MRTVVHLAGIAITIGEGRGARVIQRCSICGEKMVDVDLSRTAIASEGKFDAAPGPESVSRWETGRLVECSVDEFPQQWVLLENPADGKLPKDSCIDLVEG